MLDFNLTFIKLLASLQVLLLSLVLIGIAAESYMQAVSVEGENITLSDLGDEDSEGDVIEFDLEKDKDKFERSGFKSTFDLEEEVKLVLAKAVALITSPQSPYFEQVAPPPEV